MNDHLRNVMAVISDKKSGAGVSLSGYASYYKAEVINEQDYYPFGMEMKERGYALNSAAYKYGFNGKEKDDETYGSGDEYDYGMRIYDPRLGKFLSIDPLTKNYPWYTPYQFSGNNPIQFIDLDGAEPATPNKPSSEAVIRAITNDYVTRDLQAAKEELGQVFKGSASFSAWGVGASAQAGPIKVGVKAEVGKVSLSQTLNKTDLKVSAVEVQGDVGFAGAKAKASAAVGEASVSYDNTNNTVNTEVSEGDASAELEHKSMSIDNTLGIGAGVKFGPIALKGSVNIGHFYMGMFHFVKAAVEFALDLVRPVGIPLIDVGPVQTPDANGNFPDIDSSSPNDSQPVQSK